MQTAPHDNRSTPAQFRSKLGTYLMGVLIGFTLLGMIYYAKHLAVNAQQRERQHLSDQQQDPPSQMPALGTASDSAETGNSP